MNAAAKSKKDAGGYSMTLPMMGNVIKLRERKIVTGINHQNCFL